MLSAILKTSYRANVAGDSNASGKHGFIWAICFTLYTDIVFFIMQSVVEMTHMAHIDCDILYIYQANKLINIF